MFFLYSIYRGHMKHIQIIVTTHKPYWMPSDKIYFPLHVGAEGKPPLGFTGDNTGINISSKNPNYCELTGLYWLWKNKKSDYVGLCHYRRYFSTGQYNSSMDSKKSSILQKEDYDSLLKNYDCIVPKKRNYYIETVRSQYEHAHHKVDLDALERIIKTDYPEYYDAFTTVMNRKTLHLLNMFVMKWGLFDNYCNFIFPVLEKLETKIDISNYTTQEARVYGFLAERLFNVWLEKNKILYKEIPIVFLEKINWLKKGTSFLRRKFFPNK